MAVKLKSKAHHWRERSHEHALDQAMALGHRDLSGFVSQHWGEQGGSDTESPAGESKVDLQTNREAVTNLLNNCLGAGLLAVPYAVRNLGLVMAVVVLVLSAMLNRYTLVLIVKCCEIADIEVSYNKLGSHAFGAAGRALVIFVFVFMGFGCLVSYTDATADSIGGLLQVAGWPSMPMYQYQLIAFVALFPATYIRSLKSVATLSMVAFVGAIVVVVCINYTCGSQLYRTGFPDMSGLKLYETDPKILFASIPTCTTTFSIQAGGSIILSTLKDHSDENINKVAWLTKLVAWTINISVGVPMFLVFQDQVQPDALSAFDGSDPVIIVAKIALLDLLILSYMFMMIPCRVAIIELLFKKNEAKMEATQGQFLAVTTCINVAAVCVGMAVSDISTVVGLMGAIGVNIIAFILPLSIYMKVRANPRIKDMTPVPVMSASNVPYFLVILGALFLMVTGIGSIAMNLMDPPVAPAQ